MSRLQQVNQLEHSHSQNSPAQKSTRLTQLIPPGGDVIFDGDCGICTVLVRILQKLDFAKRLQFLASNDPATFAVHPGFPIERAKSELLAFDSRSGWYGGWQACEWILLRLPIFWLFVPLTLIPGSGWLGDRVYKYFALRRTKISSFLGLNACRVSDSMGRTK